RAVEDRSTTPKEEAQRRGPSFQDTERPRGVTEEEVHRGGRLLASVVQSVDDCIFTADVDGRLVTMNPAGRRLTGYAEGEIGRLGYRDLLSTSDHGEAGAIAAAVEAGRSWRGQVTGRGGGGRAFPR